MSLLVKLTDFREVFFTAIVYNIVVVVISNNRIFLLLIYINKFLQILNQIQLILAVIFRIIKLSNYLSTRHVKFTEQLTLQCNHVYV